MPSSAAVLAHDKLLQLAQEAANGALPAEAVNLFPLINRLYQRDDEGEVVELGFTTTTGSVNSPF
jgi:hypothetical protein